MKQRGFVSFGFQQACWQAIAQGQSGILHASTGSGKTLAVWLGILNAAVLSSAVLSDQPAKGLRVLWITPMRALASDTLNALSQPLLQSSELKQRLPWTLGLRTGDTTASERSRQRSALPHALVTTPESLSLFLTQTNAPELFSSLQWVVIDEWHELLGNKRGVLLQLALARLRAWNPSVCIWALSATLGNLEHARQVLHAQRPNLLVSAELEASAQRKKIEIDTLLPQERERLPWGGHLGLAMLPQVIAELELSPTTLVFTNTRSQAELWYQALLEAKPDWAGLIALHHGSLDREVREWVEQGLKEGRLKAVICTSSLDLGVDFSPVERVLQIGSAKGIARVIQRAGRSGHAPGQVSRLTLVPTHALELIEGAALRQAVALKRIEARQSPRLSMDVLIQHIVSIALSAQSSAAQLLKEVRDTWAFAELSDVQWEWALGFVGHGGYALQAYPEYHRVVVNEVGRLTVPDRQVGRRHRMSIGTIVSDAAIQVKYLRGKRIGSIEEGFIGRLKVGDCFLFGGRLLELIRLHEMTAYVRQASGKRAAVPRWNGGRMPLSSELATSLLEQLSEPIDTSSPAEIQSAEPLLRLQSQWSVIPSQQQLVVEQLESKEGFHLFVYPFAGRLVHLGLSALVAWRVSQTCPASFSIAVNDYGFELLSSSPIEWSEQLHEALLSQDNLMDDLVQSLNASELTQRRFREIARISGLVFQGYPGAGKSNKQLQASSGLFYEVFKKHDRDNLLLVQAQNEVLEQELQLDRMRNSMNVMAARRLTICVIARPTPFSFPLMVERLREKLSTEKLNDRIERMVVALQKAATP